MNGTELIELISTPTALRGPLSPEASHRGHQLTWNSPEFKATSTSDSGHFAQIRRSQPMISFPTFPRDSYVPDLNNSSGLSRQSSTFDDRRNSQLRNHSVQATQYSPSSKSALAADERRPVPLSKPLQPTRPAPMSPLDAPNAPDGPDSDGVRAVQSRKRPQPTLPSASASFDPDAPDLHRKPSTPLLPTISVLFESEGANPESNKSSASSEERHAVQTRKPSQPLYPAPSIGLDADAWVAYLTLSGLCVGEDVHATCQAAVGAVRKNFPGALPDQQMMGLILRRMAAKVPGFTPDTTMLATSFCPDEIQNSLGDLSHLLLEHFGKKFDFAGLGGVPFAGKTGFKAFAHHVPKGHDVLVVYGPHVAISPGGDVGLCQRDGQSHLSPACGACIGALAHLDACKPVPAPGSDEYDLDFQMNFLKKELQKRHSAVHSHPKGKSVGLPTEAFGIARRILEGMIDMSELPEGARVVLLGGVQLNMPRPLPNFFCPLSFTVRTADQAPESLLDSLHQDALWSTPSSPTSGAPLGRTTSLAALKSSASGSWRRASKLTGEGLPGPSAMRPPMTPTRGMRKLTLPDVP